MCEQVTALTAGDLPAAGSRTLGLFQCVRLVLLALRHDPTQELLAEILDVSQPTVSRVISAYTPLNRPGPGGQRPHRRGPRPHHHPGHRPHRPWPAGTGRTTPSRCSGKYRRTGLNVQVACTLSETLAWVSDPLPGSVHDSTAIRASGLLDPPSTDLEPGTDPLRHTGDKGYTGLGMNTPVRKQPGRPLRESDKIQNTSINTIRYVVERTIANIKTWRVLHTGYRRPTHTFPTTITAVLSLIFTYTL